jgi:transcriptional regulator GlxA family with amidase domain
MLRVWAAKDMLEHGATSVQQVSTTIGYEDVAFFRALFKRHTGMTPAAYRERFAGMRIVHNDIAAGA